MNNVLPHVVGRARRLVLVAACSLIATACQPSLQELKRELDIGVGGYTGQVVPFSVPYLLRYDAAPERRYSFAVVGSTSTGKRTDVEMRSRQKIVRLGDQLLLETAVEEIREGETVWRSVSPPLITMRALASPRGRLTDMDADFPAFRQAGAKDDIPAPGSDAYRRLVHRVRQASWELPEQPVRMNDTLPIGQHFIGLLAEELNLPPPPPTQIVKDTLVGTIVGQTTYRGAAHLVVVMSGDLEFWQGRYTVKAALRGHSLLDAKIAAVSDELILTTFTIATPSKDVSGEVLTRLSAD